MVGSSRVGIAWRSCLSIRLTAICFSIVGLQNCLTTNAMAQLRSGRTQRALYQEELAEQRQAPQVERRGAAQAASYAEPLRRSASVVERGSVVVQAACEGCDQGCDSCGSNEFEAPEYATSELGCGAPGCQMGCQTCSGGYSQIAPTCTAVCPPGCGPLLGLWYRMSVRAEVPLYWRRDQGPPALVTSATSGTPADSAGQLGESTTNILLGGGGALFEDASAGFRITLGTWLGESQRYGLLFRYWNAGDQDQSYSFDSNSFPILARPFLNTSVAGTSEQDTQLVAFPGESVGNILVSTSSSINGLELSLRRLLYMDRFTRVDWLYGYQHVSLDEGLIIASNTTVTGNNPGLQGTSIAVTDRFQTENNFNGMSHAIMSSRQFACWKMETMFRLGLGNLERKVNVSGSTTTTSAGASSTENQGLFARNTNNQAFVDDTFVVIPEVGINFAYRIRQGIDFNVGYNYMLIPKVAQAAQQLDNSLAVNLSDPLVGALDPQLDFSERSYWLHSLGLGLQLRY